MERRRNIYFIIIVLCLIYAVADSFIAVRQSYDKYLSGEYFFRQKARTVDTHGENWWATAEAQNMDYSDPKNVLLTSDNMSVYAVGPHDGVCTVCYGETVIEDFPIKNLKFEKDEEDDKGMANFMEIRKLMFILAGVDAALALILFFLYRAELDGAFNIVMLLGALYSVFFEVVSFFAFGFG